MRISAATLLCLGLAWGASPMMAQSGNSSGGNGNGNGNSTNGNTSTQTTPNGITRRIITTNEPPTPPPRPAPGPNDTKGAKRPAKEHPAASALGLPRLKANHASPLAAQKFDVDPLKVPPGATGTRKQSQRGVEYLELDPAKTWAHALKGSPKKVVFISFCANASIDTEFELAGGLMRIAQSKQPGKVQLQARVPDPDHAGSYVWRSLGYRTTLDVYNGRSLAALPVLTARLDPSAGLWDLYLGTRQLATGLPIFDETKKNAHNFRLRAGNSGAQLCSLIVSSENPLFVDANANGISDDFEIDTHGGLLSKNSSDAEKKAVAKAWHDTQKGKAGGSISARRPAPDRLAALAAAN